MGERIIEVVALKPKMYSYLTYVGYVDKKAVGTKRCIIKRKIKLKIIKSVQKIMKKFYDHNKALEVRQAVAGRTSQFNLIFYTN